MTPAIFLVCLFFIALGAGLFGSLLGLGGGIIIVPALTLLPLGIDIRFAIGASIVSVIATSSGAGAAYVKEHLANIRLSMFLEMATTIGALSGAYLAGLIAGRWLYLIFGLTLGYVAWAMWRHGAQPTRPANRPDPPEPVDPIARALKLRGSYYDPSLSAQVTYHVARCRLGFALSLLAGVISGLLGIGGGIIKVPVMNLGMRVPLKAASATSNFMIGVTAAASAGVYLARGQINPFIAAPVAIGVVLGSVVGARCMGRIRGSTLRVVFTVVLVLVAFEMIHKGIQ